MITYNRITDLKRLKFIKDTLEQNISGDRVVLDVGCGNGVISRYLGKNNYRVLGIDVSERAIEIANESNDLENVEFACLSAEQLVARGNQYDAIICSEVLEHLEKPSDLLDKLHASLKDQGILIITVPNGRGPREVMVTRPILYIRDNIHWLWKLVGKVKGSLGYSGTTNQSAADNLDHIQFFSKKALISLSKGHKFRIVRFSNSNFIEDVFPISLLTKRFKKLQEWDCKIADLLPNSLTGGFLTIWKKSIDQ